MTLNLYRLIVIIVFTLSLVANAAPRKAKAKSTPATPSPLSLEERYLLRAIRQSEAEAAKDPIEEFPSPGLLDRMQDQDLHTPVVVKPKNAPKKKRIMDTESR